MLFRSDRGRFLDADRTTDEVNRNKADTDRDYIIDDEGEMSLSMLVSIFMSMLVPETSPWMRLRISDPAFKNNKAVGVWLDDVSDLILRVFSQTDVYGTLYNTFTEFCSFGTGCQMLDSDEVNTITPHSFTFGEYMMLNGPGGMPNTFAYKSYFTAKQLKEKFGEENMSQTARTQLKENGSTDKYFLVWWLIEPIDNTDDIENPAKKAFNSIHWEADSDDTVDGRLLRVSGYDEFPVQAPRWLVISNDTYGKESPGMKQLANVKMLQSVTEDMLIAVKRIGDPPLVGNIDQENVNSLPGGWTYGVDMQGGKPSVQPLFDNYRPDINGMLVVIESVSQKIKDGFFNQLALIVSDTSDAKRMTATEVVARNDEKFAILGPILNRVFNELLKPMIDRTFNILQRQGFFDEDGEYPVPPELEGIDLDIEFESVLAKAQKAVGLNELDRYLERAGLAASVLGEAPLDAINPDELMNLWAETVPSRIINDQETRDAIREGRAEQAAAAAQQEAMINASQTTKNLASSPVGTGSALDEVTEAEQ